MLQQLTYHLCYNYARCTRSVSMVPAVYYAHLAAKRAQIFRKSKPFKQVAYTHQIDE